MLELRRDAAADVKALSPRLALLMTLTVYAGTSQLAALPLIFQPGALGEVAAWPGVAVVAWDGSRGAARALADALPLLRRARQVRILTIVNEKPGATPDLGVDVVRHLRMHGVESVRDEIDGGGTTISATLDAYLERESASLLVMGAYGHSRVREFLLGGATDYALRAPVCPVLLSH